MLDRYLSKHFLSKKNKVIGSSDITKDSLKITGGRLIFEEKRGVLTKITLNPVSRK
jgi:hypothetical protein